MLEIGSENVSKTLDEWHASYELKKKFPFFRDYLDRAYSYIFE